MEQPDDADTGALIHALERLEAGEDVESIIAGLPSHHREAFRRSLLDGSLASEVVGSWKPWWTENSSTWPPQPPESVVSSVPQQALSSASPLVGNTVAEALLAYSVLMRFFAGDRPDDEASACFSALFPDSAQQQPPPTDVRDSMLRVLAAAQRTPEAIGSNPPEFIFASTSDAARISQTMNGVLAALNDILGFLEAKPNAGHQRTQAARDFERTRRRISMKIRFLVAFVSTRMGPDSISLMSTRFSTLYDETRGPPHPPQGSR